MEEKQISKKEIIASRLKTAREQAGLSQAQVAKLLELHRPTISEIESARRNVSAEELIEFAKTYGVSVSWLSDEKEEGLTEKDDVIELAARELSKLKNEDIDKVINLLKSIIGKGS